jgi:hypothetical protein
MYYIRPITTYEAFLHEIVYPIRVSPLVYGGSTRKKLELMMPFYLLPFPPPNLYRFSKFIAD